MAPPEAVSPQRKGSKSRPRRLGPRGGDDPIKVGVCAMEKKVRQHTAATAARWSRPGVAGVPSEALAVHQNARFYLASTARTEGVHLGAVAARCAAWARP